MADIEKLEEEIEAITEKMQPLQERTRVISTTRFDRDKLNQKVKELNEEAKVLKQERDGYNKKVQAAKKKRDEVNKKLAKVKQDFAKKYPMEQGKRGPSFVKIKTDLEALRFQVETSGVDYNEELKLRGKLIKLEELYNSLKGKEDARVELNRLEKEAKTHHAVVQEFSKKSDEAHKKLVPLYENIKQIRAEANKKHEAVIAEMESMNALGEELKPDTARLQELRTKIRETTAAKKTKSKNAAEKTARQRSNEAKKKLDEGKRVDLRDLQFQLELEKGKKK